MSQPGPSSTPNDPSTPHRSTFAARGSTTFPTSGANANGKRPHGALLNGHDEQSSNYPAASITSSRGAAITAAGLATPQSTPRENHTVNLHETGDVVDTMAMGHDAAPATPPVDEVSVLDPGAAGTEVQSSGSAGTGVRSQHLQQQRQTRTHQPSGYTWVRAEDEPGYAWKNKKVQDEAERFGHLLAHKDQVSALKAKGWCDPLAVVAREKSEAAAGTMT